MLSPKQISHDSLSFISLEDLEPRLPPRLSCFPAPFDFPEKPILQVPDVSLIFDGGNTLKNNNLTLKRAPTPTPTTTPTTATASKSNSSPRRIPSNVDVWKELAAQRLVIERMEKKLDKIIEFQDGFLAQLFRKGQLISREVQTEENDKNANPNNLHSIASLYCSNYSSSSDDENSASSPIIKLKPPGFVKENHRKENHRKGSPPTLVSSISSSSSSSGKNHQFIPKPKAENENEVVLKTKQYLETLGVRFGSPIRNPPTPNPNLFAANGIVGTEMTVYGMTPSNLSFATKDYLQRYGLVTQGQGQPPSLIQSPPTPSNKAPVPKRTHQKPSPREKDRILNMTAIKNQPKLF